jgi:hypothetical protein
MILGRGTGYLFDQPDRRDLPLGSILESKAPPLTASVEHPLVTARNQSRSNSCVGFAWAQAVRLAYLAQGVPCPDLSPLFAYYLARSTHQSTARDDGTYLRAAAKAIISLGIASEKAWPFSLLRVNRAPSMGAHRDGHDRKGLRGYYRVAAGDLDGVRRAIAAGYPVTAGWQIDKAFMANKGPEFVESFGSDTVGGHAMTVVAYDEHSFTLLNSWGTSWRGGTVKIGEKAMSQAHDIWAIRVRP